MPSSRHHALTAKHRIVQMPVSIAEFKSSGPFAERQRCTQIQRAGHTFQKRVHKILAPYCIRNAAITSYTHAQWIEFADAAGHGWAQPDWFVVVAPERRLIIGECKLTQTPVAWLQMAELYAPLLKVALPCDIQHVTLVQCVKNLSIADTTDAPLVWTPSAVFDRAFRGEEKILWCASERG